MTDTVSKEARSRTMRAVHSRDTSLEVAFRRALVARGLRGYRVAPAGMLGKPDVLYTRARLVVFIDSCFWHGCPEHCRRPSSNTGYWDAKLARNIVRDQRVTATLTEQGWTVLRLWEHELKGNLHTTVERIAALLEELRSANR